MLSAHSRFIQMPLSASIKSDMLAKTIWQHGCPVAMERLVLLNLSYIDFDGKEQHSGQMVVFDVMADAVLDIFRILYLNRFPVYSIKLINDFDGDDVRSLKANNTSCFNYRKIINSDKYSIHSYGMAIDLNPIQNPYLDTEYRGGKKNIQVLPPEGMSYVNRANIRKGMVESYVDARKKQSVVSLFKDKGFKIWGGDWNFPIDWQHFQVAKSDAEELTRLSFDNGMRYFTSMLR